MKRTIIALLLMMVLLLIPGISLYAKNDILVAAPTLELSYELDYEHGWIILKTEGVADSETSIAGYEFRLIRNNSGNSTYSGPVLSSENGIYTFSMDVSNEDDTAYTAMVVSLVETAEGYDIQSSSESISINIDRSLKTYFGYDYTGLRDYMLPLMGDIDRHTYGLRVYRSSFDDENDVLISTIDRSAFSSNFDDPFYFKITDERHLNQGFNQLYLIAYNGFGETRADLPVMLQRFECSLDIPAISEDVDDIIYLRFQHEEVPYNQPIWVRHNLPILRYIPLDIDQVEVQQQDVEDDAAFVRYDSNMWLAIDAGGYTDLVASNISEVPEAVTYQLVNDEESGQLYLHGIYSPVYSVAVYYDHENGQIELDDDYTLIERIPLGAKLYDEQGNLLGSDVGKYYTRRNDDNTMSSLRIIPDEGYVAKLYLQVNPLITDDIYKSTIMRAPAPLEINHLKLFQTYTETATVTLGAGDTIKPVFYVQFVKEMPDLEEEKEDEPTAPVQNPSPKTIYYTLTITTTSGGSVPGFLGSNTFASGTHVNLTLIEDEGYVFTGWTGDTSMMINDNIIVLTSDAKIEAVFAALEPDFENPEVIEETQVEEPADITDEILDDITPESSPNQEIEDDALPQTGGISLLFYGLAASGMIGSGIAMRVRKRQ